MACSLVVMTINFPCWLNVTIVLDTKLQVVDRKVIGNGDFPVLNECCHLLHCMALIAIALPNECICVSLQPNTFELSEPWNGTLSHHRASHATAV